MLALLQYGLIYPLHCEMQLFFLIVDAELQWNEGISTMSQIRLLWYAMPAGISDILSESGVIVEK